MNTPLVKTTLVENVNHTSGNRICETPLVKIALVKTLTEGTFIDVTSVFNRHLITLVYAPLIDQAGGTSLTSSNTHIFVIL